MEDVYFRILLLQICAQFSVFMPFSAIFGKLGLMLKRVS